MPRTALINDTAATARRMLLIALAGGALIGGAVLVERMSFEHQQKKAMQELIASNQAASDVLLADERLTMSAYMAATTGEPRWVNRYEAIIPQIDDAIRRALALAPASVARKFDAETRVANDQLVSLERAAFRSVKAGDARAARRLLDSGLYRHNKAVLSLGTSQFLAGTATAIEAKLHRLQLRTRITIPVVLLVSFCGALLVWRRLNASLFRSIDVFAAAETIIQNLAMSDALTGLANRRALYVGLNDALSRAKTMNSKVAVYMIDLDRFKPVNDQSGHRKGDLVLKEVAERLRHILPADQIRARYGGDEFVAVLEYDGNDEIVRLSGEEIIAAIASPISIEGTQLQIGATIGSAIYPSDASTDDELLRKADIALYRAKKEARGTVFAYSPSLDVDLKARAELECELREAIVAGVLVPYFQPQIDLQSREPRGCEVLCRWPHPVLGLLEPAQFIPLAEVSGLINDLMVSLLRTACMQARALPQHMTIAINVAPQQIQDLGLAHRILAVLIETDFAPQRLEVELTENALVDDLAEAKRVISTLKGLGIKVALDDFGMGYSSLGYLAELPIDTIKIDRSFIKTMHEREESAKIVAAILGLGRSLHLRTVGEGVESERDAEFLAEHGCTLGQGYYFAHPMPIAEAVAFVRQSAPEDGFRHIA